MSASPRVLMVVSRFHPYTGGAEKQCLNLSRSLRDSGIDVSVLTFSRDPSLPESEDIQGVPVKRIPLYGQSKPGQADAALLKRLISLRGSYDILHNHIASTHTITCTVARRLLGKRLIVKIANSGSASDLGHGGGFSGMIRSAVRSADRVISICGEIRKELLDSGVSPQRIADIPNGVDLSSFQPPSNAVRLARRAELDLPADAVIVLRVGTLLQKKGLPVLLEAWEAVLRDCPNAYLVSVGGDAVPPELQEQAKAASRFRLVTAIPDVRPYYEAAELFVLPSLAEGLSNALLEAQAMGLPAVATRVGGNPDIITDGENGILLEPGDPQALAEILLRLTLDTPLRRKLGERAAESVRRYSMPSVVSRYCELYQSLL